jgi:hypothetical protein
VGNHQKRGEEEEVVYWTIPSGDSPPSLSPEGTVRYTLIFINNTLKYRPQDEPFLRSATLDLYLTVNQKPFIYPI